MATDNGDNNDENIEQQHQQQQNQNSPVVITPTKDQQGGEAPSSSSSSSSSPPSAATNEKPNTTTNHITEEELSEIQTELSKSLQEESLLLSLQMQLTVKLEELNKAVKTAETEEQLTMLALQQARVVRLLQSEDCTDENDEELVTINIQNP